MTRNYFDKELEHLQLSILRMGSRVEEALINSIQALKSQNIELAEKVIIADDVIDKMEMEIEDLCLKLIALQQPIAKDLRMIATALKIITDLERMADHAVDIAKITKRLANETYIKELIDIPRMAEIVTEMVRDCIDAYVNQDAEKAKEISERDDVVDGIHAQIFRELLVLMMEDPKKINQSTSFLFVSQYIERVADHVTNICEWVIYTKTGVHPDLNE